MPHRPDFPARRAPWHLAGLATLGIVLAGCGDDDATAEINVFIYSEYIDPGIVSDFEKAKGVRVNLSFFEKTEEMIDKLDRGGGKSQYDLVVAANQAIPVMARLGLIRKLDRSKISNLANLDEFFTKMDADPGNVYSAPYQWGTTGILYDRKKFPNLPESWAVVFDPEKFSGSFVLMDELRDQLGAALKYLGHSANSTDPAELEEAGETLLAAKRSSRCQGFVGAVEGKNRVADGRVDMAVVWNGDALRAIGEDEEGRLAFMVPGEGSIIWADLVAIPSEAPNPDGAHAFLEYLLDAKVGARLSNFNKFATPNKASMPHIDPADAKNPDLYPPPEARARLEYLQDLGEHTRLYDETWTAVNSR